MDIEPNLLAAWRGGAGKTEGWNVALEKPDTRRFGSASCKYLDDLMREALPIESRKAMGMGGGGSK